MASTEHLDAYLVLERLMLRLDAQSDPMADDIRDLMDPLWHRLDDSHIEYLNQRKDVDPLTQQPLRFQIDFFSAEPKSRDPSGGTERTPPNHENCEFGLTLTGWEFAA